MKKKILIGTVTCLLAVALIMVSRAENTDIIHNSKELFRQVQLFADSITLVTTDYVESVKMKDLVYGAIKGMMNSLDGYSQFLDPESFKEITEETRGEFGGIGIEIGMRDGILTVIAPMEGTPAHKAGMQAGDKIVKIYDKITRDMSLDEAVKKLRGEVGEKVNITVIREGVEELLDFSIARAIIKLESIKDVKIMEKDIGYVRILEFQEKTARDLRRKIKELIERDARDLILDLRNNPGGLLDSAIEVADLFLEPGQLIVYTEGRDPAKRVDYKSKKGTEFGKLNIVLLVNRGSASAAEILAGALRDNRRGLIVGTTTFGKGSVQTVIPLGDDSALRLTTAAYFTPSGGNLMNKGIDPDVYVELIKNAHREEESEKSEIFEKLEEEKEKKTDEEYDNQILTAVNVLKGARLFKEYKPSASEKKDEEVAVNG